MFRRWTLPFFGSISFNESYSAVDLQEITDRGRDVEVQRGRVVEISRPRMIRRKRGIAGASQCRLRYPGKRVAALQ